MNTILLVEDARDLAQVVKRELEQAGFQVWLAEDGLQALAQIEARSPDLVILDWMLPKLDGLDVLRRVRQHLVAPVLMLTARSDPADRVVGLEMGADDYLVKPFHLSELVARVRALLRRSERIRQQLAQDQAPGEKILSWHVLTLDPGQRTCFVAGEALELTRIEFDLLHLLLRYPGRTFNRIYLLETVWNVPYVSGDRAVDNTMLRLRKKLGALGDELETVRGVGYRLRPIA